MPTHNLNSMSVDALLKLKADVEQTLNSRATQLRNELSQLSGHQRMSSLKGKKVLPKYRGPGGVTWAGRGAKPRWLVAALKRGKKLDQFLIKRSK